MRTTYDFCNIVGAIESISSSTDRYETKGKEEGTAITHRCLEWAIPVYLDGAVGAGY